MSPSRAPQFKNLPPWVLVVDDEEAMCRLIVSALEGEPVEVVTAPSGAAALKIVAERPTEPLLALIDVMMPGIDGLTLARKLSSTLKRTKLVIMSGHLSDVSWWPADLREVAFVAKPFHMTALAEFLREARLRADGRS
ncbi:MAG TPA: response regulator [Candidatus Didemnitutus sp.]|jgi:CheY-like chemotaxis protein